MQPGATLLTDNKPALPWRALESRSISSSQAGGTSKNILEGSDMLRLQKVEGALGGIHFETFDGSAYHRP